MGVPSMTQSARPPAVVVSVAPASHDVTLALSEPAAALWRFTTSDLRTTIVVSGAVPLIALQKQEIGV